MQLSYNGLTFGSGTAHRVTSLQGLDDLPDVRMEIFPIAGASGSFIYSQDTDERHIVIEGLVVDSVSLEDTLAEWKDTFAVVQATPIPLTIEIEDRTFSIDCVPARAKFSRITGDYNAGVVRFAVELVAEDPTISEGSS